MFPLTYRAYETVILFLQCPLFVQTHITLSSMLIIAQSPASGHSRSTDNSSVSDVVGLTCNSFFFKNYPVWTAAKMPKLLILVTSCVYPAEASSHSQDSALLNVSSFREIVGKEQGMLLLQMVIVLMNIISHGIFSPLWSCWACFESSSKSWGTCFLGHITDCCGRKGCVV